MDEQITRLSPDVDLAEFVSDVYRMYADNGELRRWKQRTDKSIAESYCERAFEGASHEEWEREVEFYTPQIAYYR